MVRWLEHMHTGWERLRNKGFSHLEKVIGGV